MIKVYIYLFILIFIIIIYNICIYNYNENQKNNIKEKRKIPEKERVEILENMLTYITKIAEENNIKIIPSYGTLLGLIRENEIIKHDYDLDLFLFEDDWKKLKNILSNEEEYKFKEKDILWHRKFNIISKKRNIETDFLILYEKRKNVTLDVLLSFSNTGTLDGSLNLKSPFRGDFKKNDILPLEKKTTKYGDLYFPRNPENLLVKWYGKDWKTPKIN